MLFWRFTTELSNRCNIPPNPTKIFPFPFLAWNKGNNKSPRLGVIPTWSITTAVFSYSLVNHHIKINTDLRHVMCNKFKNNSKPDLATHDSSTICKIIYSFYILTIANTYIWILRFLKKLYERPKCLNSSVLNLKCVSTCHLLPLEMKIFGNLWEPQQCRLYHVSITLYGIRIMKILCITRQHAMYFVKYETHSAPNFPKQIHIVNDNIYKKYITYCKRYFYWWRRRNNVRSFSNAPQLYKMSINRRRHSYNCLKWNHADGDYSLNKNFRYKFLVLLRNNGGSFRNRILKSHGTEKKLDVRTTWNFMKLVHIQYQSEGVTQYLLVIEIQFLSYRLFLNSKF